VSAGDPHPEADRPWYHYLWPWFMVVLLSSTVIGGIATVVIAVVNRDPLVREDWYEDGTAINRRLGRELYAEQLGLQAGLVVSLVEGRIEAVLEGAGSGGFDAMDLVMSHATVSDRDVEITLLRQEGNRFEGMLEGQTGQRLQGRWYVTLEPSYDAAQAEDRAIWRLSGTLRLPSDKALRLGAGT